MTTIPTSEVADDSAASDAKSPHKSSGLTPEQRTFYQAYYLLQAQRQGQFETTRLTVSNFVLAGSLVALGFTAGKEALPGHVVFIVLCAVAVANLLAVVYARTSRYWVKVHQARAAHALDRLAPELVAVHDEIASRSRKEMLSGSSGGGGLLKNMSRSQMVQSGFHLVLVAGVLGFGVWTCVNFLASRS